MTRILISMFCVSAIFLAGCGDSTPPPVEAPPNGVVVNPMPTKASAPNSVNKKASID